MHPLGLGLREQSDDTGKIFVCFVLVCVIDNCQVGWMSSLKAILFLLHLEEVVVFLLRVCLNLIAQFL